MACTSSRSFGNRAPFADPHARAVIAGLGMEAGLDNLVALYVAGVCSIAYGLRQIIEAQADAGAPIERVMISGGAGRLDLVRQLLADATGKPVLATQVDEPVLLGAAMLGAVAGGLFGDVRSAMSGMARVEKPTRRQRAISRAFTTRGIGHSSACSVAHGKSAKTSGEKYGRAVRSVVFT